MFKVENVSRMNKKETIVAQATGPARGGIGIIRLSGVDALDLALQLFAPKIDQGLNQKNCRPNHMYYGDFNDLKGTHIDDGYFVYFKSPNSYTGEDSVELNLHGNPLVLNHMLEVLCRLGARLANPGEFTQRAYLNGKMNLLEAEAVAEFIDATSLQASHYAKQRLQGVLSDKVDVFYVKALEVLAECEADIDFPDENLPIESRQHILDKLDGVCEYLHILSDSYAASRKIQDGYKVVLCGAPNVGKSSLFNALLNEERAIVSDIAGTTRDRLRESLEIEGCPVQFIDTAGLRDGSNDKIEQEGMRLSLQELKAADLVCFMSDHKRVDRVEDLLEYEKTSPENIWYVYTKLDINDKLGALHNPKKNRYVLSAKTGDGLGAFKDALANKVKQNLNQEQVLLGNLRQKQFVDRSRESFLSAKNMWLRGKAEEFVALELREGLKNLMLLLGKEDITEEILDTVFSKFCVGK